MSPWVLRMYFVIILFIMTFLHVRDSKIRHFRKRNENAGDSDNVEDVLVAKGDHEMLSRKFLFSIFHRKFSEPGHAEGEPDAGQAAGQLGLWQWAQAGLWGGERHQGPGQHGRHHPGARQRREGGPGAHLLPQVSWAGINGECYLTSL